MHALGYSMTYFHNIPHGFANLYFCKPYFNHMLKCEREKTLYIVEQMGFSNMESMCDFFLRNMEIPKLSEEQCVKYAALAMIQSSIKATPGELTLQEIEDVYREAGGL